VSIFSLSVSAVRAQELPAADLAVGDSHFREGFSPEVNGNGGTAAFTGYANRWLGITGDFGAYHASPFGVSANTYTFLVGPRFSYRHSGPATPFAQVLLGGAHLTVGASGLSASTSGFAWSAGGGIGPGLSRHLAFRPQFDYVGIDAAKRNAQQCAGLS
jgi:hypothetical protein